MLCELIRNAPVLHLEFLVFGNPNLIQILTDALTLMQNDILMDCLRALTRIILAWPTRKDIWNMIVSAKLQQEVELLTSSPCPEISNLAIAILEEYLQK